MQRDMDLIRELLLKLEALDIPPGVGRLISPYAPELAIENATPDDIKHHLHMLVSGDLVVTGGSIQFLSDGSLSFRQLSWAGRDFLDSVRSPEVWANTKKGAVAAGGFTVEILKELAKGLVKKQIEEFTGVKL